MTSGTDLAALKSRINELEDRVKFLYKFVRIKFSFAQRGQRQDHGRDPNREQG